MRPSAKLVRKNEFCLPENNEIVFIGGRDFQGRKFSSDINGNIFHCIEPLAMNIPSSSLSSVAVLSGTLLSSEAALACLCAHPKPPCYGGYPSSWLISQRSWTKWLRQRSHLLSEYGTHWALMHAKKLFFQLSAHTRIRARWGCPGPCSVHTVFVSSLCTRC